MIVVAWDDWDDHPTSHITDVLKFRILTICDLEREEPVRLQYAFDFSTIDLVSCVLRNSARPAASKDDTLLTYFTLLTLLYE